MKILKGENGITLIALVITIIVLLLLAGVTISTLTGDNGILTQVQKASEKSKNAETLENIRLAFKAADIERHTGNESGVRDKLKEYLQGVYGVENVEVESNGSGGWLITIKGKKYEINANGEVLLGYFKTEGGVARYYESESDTTGTPITSANMGEYLGRKVKYTPGNAGTNTSYGTSTDYRLFYVDIGTGTNGKYGDGQGTMYLKADCDTKNVKWSSYIEYDKGTSGDSSDSRATMFKLNPGMNNTKVDDYHDCGVAWMLDPAQWSEWKDGNIKLATDNTAGSGINYVVGGPSMEMYVDSYNAYLDAHTENNVVQIYKNGSTTDRAEKLDCEYVTSGYNAKGYRIGFKNTAKANWANTGYNQANNSLFAYNSANGQQMYNPGSSRYYWLASPSAGDTNHVMFVSGDYNRVGYYAYGYDLAFCPLVSIKSGVSIEEKR